MNRGGRPPKPMFPALTPHILLEDCAEGALSYDGAAQFLGVSVRMIERLIQRGELEAVYEGRKPRVLKRHLQLRLARQLEEARTAALGIQEPETP